MLVSGRVQAVSRAHHPNYYRNTSFGIKSCLATKPLEQRLPPASTHEVPTPRGIIYHVPPYREEDPLASRSKADPGSSKTTERAGTRTPCLQAPHMPQTQGSQARELLRWGGPGRGANSLHTPGRPHDRRACRTGPQPTAGFLHLPYSHSGRDHYLGLPWAL